MLQTADGEQYKDMLALSRTANEAYALKHGFRYQSYIGIKRGCFPWHAVFNRIFLIHEFIVTGFGGWIFYLDADAYVYDRDFDLARYIDGYSDKALIAAPAGTSGDRWNINSGVLLFNLGHATGRQIIEDWHADIMQSSDEQLRSAKIWGLNVEADQRRLTRILRKNPDYLAALHLAKQSIFNNHKASFVRHILRLRDGKKLSIAERIAIMREDIAIMREDIST